MSKISIEFAGLGLVAVPKVNGTIRLLLPDARAVGGPPHSAVLLIKDHKGLKGSPDFTITHYKDRSEYAGWFLRGEVLITGAIAKPRRPTLSAIMDMKHIGAARKLRPLKDMPLAAYATIRGCELVSAGNKTRLRFVTIENGKKNEVLPFKYLSERIVCRLGNMKSPFKLSLKRTNGKRQIITVSHEVEQRLVISNLTAGHTKSKRHFDVFYKLMDATRKPRPDRNSLIDDFPENPDECRLGKFRE